MRVTAQMAMVMNLDKCIGCHTCSVTCEQAWTNRSGVEYVWFNNVETRPGQGCPRTYEDQDRWQGGWVLNRRGPRSLCHAVPVVISDDRDVIRYLDSAFTQRIRDTARDLVIAAEERIGARVRAQHHLHGPPTPGLAPVSVVCPATRERQPRAVDQADRARGPVAGSGMMYRPSDVRDSGAAKSEQVLDGERRTARIVRDHGHVVRVR
jgi:ferredoxin